MAGSPEAEQRDASEANPVTRFRDNFRACFDSAFPTRRLAARLLHRQRFIKPRLAAIGGVAMNDPVFGRFVDRRNCRTELIGCAIWRGPDLFLQSAQVRLNASITGRPLECLSGTFSC